MTEGGIKPGVKRMGGKKKKAQSIEGKKRGRKPGGVEVHFGKVAPKTLMPVFNTSQNLLIQNACPLKTASNTRFETTTKKKEKKKKVYPWRRCLRSVVKILYCSTASGVMPKQQSKINPQLIQLQQVTQVKRNCKCRSS